MLSKAGRVLLTVAPLASQCAMMPRSRKGGTRCTGSYHCKQYVANARMGVQAAPHPAMRSKAAAAAAWLGSGSDMPACRPAHRLWTCGPHAVSAAGHGGGGAQQVALSPPSPRGAGAGGAAGLLPHLALTRPIAGSVADAAPAGAPTTGGLPARHAHAQRRGGSLRLLHLPHLASVAPETGGEAAGSSVKAGGRRRRSVAGLLPAPRSRPGRITAHSPLPISGQAAKGAQGRPGRQARE